LERRLLLLRHIEHGVSGREEAVVNDLINSSSVQYAVIEVLHTETSPERLVIAYPNEQTLRDLIAVPSIVALGFASREEAIAGSRVCVPTAIPYPQIPEAMAGGRTKATRQRLGWAEWRGETGSALRRLGRFLVNSYGDVLVSAVVIFSSRNALSAVVRVVLGSSV
jgi:hypothetical protein